MNTRPILRLTVLALPAFAALLALGTWQVERLHWKERLIAERGAALDSAPVALPESAAAARSLDFHPVRASGVFLHDREFAVNATERRSGAAGFLVVTPLALTGGGLVLVERGWVPVERKNPETRAAGELAGTVAVEGLLRLPREGKLGWFVPENRPERNEWYTIDIAAMAGTLGRAGAAVLPFYVEAGAAPNPGGLPVGGQARTDLPNDHLQYAITWYALAVALAVIYALLVRRQGIDSKLTAASRS